MFRSAAVCAALVMIGLAPVIDGKPGPASGAVATRKPQQPPTFSARVEAVRVDALVTENGHPVRGLRAMDFLVTDSGVPQQVDLLAVDNLPLNVVLAFDVSSSVSGTRLGQLRSASDVLLENLRAGDRVALVTFNDAVRLRSTLTGNLPAVRRALEEVRAGGGTALVDGSYLALLRGDPDAARDLVIVFSDGFDTCSWLPADAVVEAARRSGPVAYAVSVADAGASPVFLRDLTGATGGRVIEIDSTWNLSSAFVDVLEEFRQRYVVSYSPRGVPKGGWHRLEVRVKGRGKASVKAREGYFSTP